MTQQRKLAIERISYKSVSCSVGEKWFDLSVILTSFLHWKQVIYCIVRSKKKLKKNKHLKQYLHGYHDIVSCDEKNNIKW